MSIHTYSKKLHIVSRYLRQIGNVALVVMMFLTTVDVVGRYYFNAPILGAFEITEYLMLLLIFSFLAFTQAEKANIRVDIVFKCLPPRLQIFIERINHMLCLLIMLLVAWMGARRTLELHHTGEMSTLLEISDYPFAFFLVLSCAALCFEFLIDLVTPEKNEKLLNK